MLSKLTPRTTSISLLSLTLAIAPFFSGLYEDVHRYFFMAILLALCAYTLAFVVRGPLVIPRAGIFALALAGLYIVRIFVRPASYLGAVNGALIILTSVALYLTWANLQPTDSERRLLSTAIILSSFSLAALGLTQYIRASLNQTLIARLTTSFGYANATASWLVLGFILAFMLLQAPYFKRGWLLTALPAPIIGAALILTGSRGGWLTLALVLFLAFVLSPKRFRLLGQGTMLVLASIVIAALVTTRPTWSVFAILLAIALATAVLVNLVREKHIAIGLVVITLVLLVAGVQVSQRLNTTTYTLSNASSQNQSTAITFEQYGLQPGITYTYRATVEAHNPNEAPYAATIALWSRVSGVNTERLFSKNIVSTEALEVEFTLPEGTDGVALSFTNLHPNTSAVLLAPTLIAVDTQIALENVYHKVLPYSIATSVARLVSTNLTAEGRLEFFRDALKVLRLSPLFGYGGGAWQAVYSSVQSFYYGSARAHSDPIEILLDVGFVGFALYVAFIAFSVIPVFLRGKSISPLDLACVLTFLALVVHSTAEALIGFPALYFATFALLGVSQAVSASIVVVSKPARRLIVTALALWALIGLSFGTSEVMSIKGTPEALRLATLFNPLHPQHKVNLAHTSPANIASALLESANLLEPYSPVYAAYLGKHYLATSNYIPAIGVLSKAVDLQPMNITNYENAAFAAAEAANAMYKVSLAEASAFAQQVLDIQQRFLQVRANTDPAALKRNPAFKLTPSLSVDIGRAYAVLGQNEEAWVYLSQVTGDNDGSLTRSALPWLKRLTSLYDASGRRSLSLTFSAWTLSGGAYIDINGELALPSYGATAISPLIYIGLDTNWTFSADHYSDEIRTGHSEAGRLWNSVYYDNQFAKTPNSANWPSNGNAQNFPIGEWATHSWSYLGGNEVEYIRISIISNTTHSSPSYKARNPVLTTR